MAKKSAVTEGVTEYVLRANGQPLMSHKEQAVIEHKRVACIVDDHAQGIERVYTITERNISAEALTEKAGDEVAETEV